MSNEQIRGKRIYFYGTGASATPITATLGRDAIPVPGSAFPCANCHGHDGQGRPEGEAVPADIRWNILTKPYELTLQSARKRAPYTERSLKRAITLGLDSSGNMLNAGMPRFQMSQSDLADLAAYLKVLDLDRDPGITDDQVRVGVILPPRRMVEMHYAVESVLKAYFDEINKAGGIFGRRIEGRFLDYPEFSETRREKVRDFLVTENIFALASSFIAGGEAQLAPLFQQTETPAVVGFALYPQISSPLNPFVFYLDEGIFGQVKALTAFAARRSHAGDGPPAILYSDSVPSSQLADAVEQQCKALGLTAPVRLMISNEKDETADIVRQIFQVGSSFVVVLEPSSDLLSVLQQVTESNTKTAFLIPGSLVQVDLLESPAVISSRIFLAYPVSQPRLSDNASAEYQRLAEPQRPHHWDSDQWLALSAAMVLIEGLKRTGRDLSREAFITSLEGLSSFDSGFSPPISYGPNQRTGNTRIQIMGVDLKNRKLIPEDEN